LFGYAQSTGISDNGDVGTGGNNTIQGRIYYPSGRDVDKRLRVTIVSVRGGEYTAYTDDTGRFTFRRLADGTYRITVDAGKEYQLAHEQVDILGQGSRKSSRGETITVQIQLQSKASASKKPEVLNAELADVPEGALALYNKSHESSSSGNESKAIEELKQAVAIYPEFAAAFDELGVLYINGGQLDKASDAFRSAIRIKPESFPPHLHYGIVLLSLKRFANAETELRQAVARNESSGSAHYYLGRTLAVERKFDEGEKELVQAISLGGVEVAGAHKFLGAIYQSRGDDARAIAELETYLRLVPKAPEAEQVRKVIKELRDQTAKK
jgi:tetratricopeptide (TPR) repeat protein